MTHIFDFSSKAFWGPLAERLKGVGVDLQGRHGRGWMDAFEASFSKADLRTARVALAEPPSDGPWIIDIDIRAERLATTDCTVYGTNLENALAFLLSRATSESYFPDSVQLDEASRCIRFEQNGAPWARLFQVTMETAGDAVRSRAASTLMGVRVHEHPGEELARRLRRWPGMGDLKIGRDVSTLRALKNHVPDPKEWRISAETLLEQMGLPTDQKSVQQLLCAVFEAPSWNHLTAAIKRSRAAGMQPVAIEQDDGSGDYSLVGIYADFFDALPHFTNSLAQKSGEWGGLFLDEIGIYGAPHYVVRGATKEGSSKWDSPSISMSMLTAVSDEWDDDRMLVAVQTTLGSEGQLSQDALEDLFMIRTGAATKRRIVDQVSGLRLITEEAGWRFHKWDGGSEPTMVIERVDGAGNRIQPAVYVNLLKAHIVWVKSAGLYAITGEYDGKCPQVALDISASTAERVAAAMPDMITSRGDSNFDRKDREEFARLAANMPRA